MKFGSHLRVSTVSFFNPKKRASIARAMVCWRVTMLYPASGSAGFTSGVGRVSIEHVLRHMDVYWFIGRRGAGFSAQHRPVATPPLSLRASHLCVRGRWGWPSSHCGRKISGRFALAREMRMVALPLLVPGEEAVAYTVTDDAAPIFHTYIAPRSAPCGAPLQPAVLVCV
jgi:hypothetical protein